MITTKQYQCLGEKTNVSSWILVLLEFNALETVYFKVFSCVLEIWIFISDKISEKDAPTG